MPATATGKNNLLTDGVTAWTHAAAFSDLGVTEISGGSYARQAISWAAAGSGVRATSAQLSIPIPAGSTVVALGVFNALTVGVQQAFGQVGSTLRGAATVTTGDTFTSVGHGLATDDRVFFSTVAGDALPAGLSATTLYFVRATGLTADAFTVATTSGGAAVDVTAAGEAAWYKTVPQVFTLAGNLIVAAGNLVVDLVGTG
jgi:hypothetical protein